MPEWTTLRDRAASPRRSTRPPLALAALVLTCAPARAIDPLVFGTAGDGNAAVVLPDPAAGLPAPIQSTVVLPAGASPHGVDFLSADEVLVADFGAPRIFRIRASTAQLIGTIATTGRTFANGTLAVSPDGSVAISAGEPTVNGPNDGVVIRAPWGAGAQVTPLPLPAGARVRSFSTQGIVFASNGRAFVCHTTGISALDPPYTSVAFTIALPSTFGTTCALSRDDQRLYATRGGQRRIEVFAAPFGAGTPSQPIAYPADAGDDLGPMVIAPDRTQLLIGQVFRRANQTTVPNARAWVVTGLDATPAFVELTLPAAISGNACQGSETLCPGFEDAAASGDGPARGLHRPKRVQRAESRSCRGAADPRSVRRRAARELRGRHRRRAVGHAGPRCRGRALRAAVPAVAR
jgi:hypothetical protein